METDNFLTGRPGQVAQRPVVKPSNLDQLDTLVTIRIKKKSNHAICLNVAIRSPGPIGLHAQPLASLVDKRVVTDGLVATKMTFPRLDRVKLVMGSTPIGRHGMPALKPVLVAINSVFDLILVVSLMNVVSDVNLLRLRPVGSRVNGHSGPITLHALQPVQMEQ